MSEMNARGNIIIELKGDIRKLEKENAELKQENAKFKQRLEQREIDITETLEENEKFTNAHIERNKQLESENKVLNVEIDRLRSRMTHLIILKNALRTMKNEALKENADLKEEIKLILYVSQQHLNEIGALKLQIKEYDVANAKLREQIENLDNFRKAFEKYPFPECKETILKWIKEAGEK